MTTKIDIRKFSFSSDNGLFSRKDLDENGKISEEFFNTEKDSTQFETSDENHDWIYENNRDYLNILRYGAKIVGYTFVLPSSREIMDDFLIKKINEAELFEKIKKYEFVFPSAIYLCATVIKKEYRGYGMAAKGMTKSILSLTQYLSKEPTLFYWKYSIEGEKIAKKVAERTGLELKVKE